MGQADLPIAFVVMPGEAKGWKSIEMTPLIRRLVIIVISIAAAVVAAWLFESFLNIGSLHRSRTPGTAISWAGLG